MAKSRPLLQNVVQRSFCHQTIFRRLDSLPFLGPRQDSLLQVFLNVKVTDSIL